MIDHGAESMFVVIAAVAIGAIIMLFGSMLFEETFPETSSSSEQYSESYVEDDSMEKLEIGEW